MSYHIIFISISNNLYLIIKEKGFLPKFWGFHLSLKLQGLPPVSYFRLVRPSVKPRLCATAIPSPLIDSNEAWTPLPVRQAKDTHKKGFESRR
jgi:hypothetical protein